MPIENFGGQLLIALAVSLVAVLAINLFTAARR